MQVNTRNGTLVYKLTKTDVRTLTKAADLLSLLARCDHKNAGDLAKLVRGIALSEECAGEQKEQSPETPALTPDAIDQSLESCTELRHVAAVETDIENSTLSDNDRTVALSCCNTKRREIMSRHTA